jgi:hypothetical protein
MPADEHFTTLLPEDEPTTDVTFQQGLEQLFQNITMSMMSADLLQYVMQLFIYFIEKLFTNDLVDRTPPLLSRRHQ